METRSICVLAIMAMLALLQGCATQFSIASEAEEAGRAAAPVLRFQSISIAPTAIVEDSCISQVEFAGVLRGARNEDGARQLVDFLLSRSFQQDVPLSMFVYPVVSGTRLPPEFRRFAVVPENPLELPPDEIEANRDRWVKEWTRVVLR